MVDGSRYSPPACIGCATHAVSGNPDEARISTSFVERQNLTMRMRMRRFTRQTYGFSKKIDNHEHAISLHFMHDNFVKKHTTIKTTPAMKAALQINGAWKNWLS